MKLYFTKEKTTLLKGIAILLMITLHCFSSEYWKYYDFSEFSDSKLISFMGAMKICVGIYTFLVGFGYAFAKEKNLKYSLKHIVKLLLPFWVILFFFTLPFFVHSFDLKVFLLNLFGINSIMNYFSWFVAFFIYAMFILPLISRFISNDLIKTSLIIAIFYVLEVILHLLCSTSLYNDFVQRAFDCVLQTPIMILGYVLASNSFFDKISIKNSRLFFLISVCLIPFILFLRSNFSSFYGFNLDFFYVPIFIFSLLVIFSVKNNFISLIKKLIIFFGKYSVYMWFFHALFFTQKTLDFYQPLVLISNNLWIVTLFVVFVTLLFSIFLDYLTKPILMKLLKFLSL